MKKNSSTIYLVKCTSYYYNLFANVQLKNLIMILLLIHFIAISTLGPITSIGCKRKTHFYYIYFIIVTHIIIKLKS